MPSVRKLLTRHSAIMTLALTAYTTNYSDDVSEKGDSRNIHRLRSQAFREYASLFRASCLLEQRVRIFRRRDCDENAYKCTCILFAPSVLLNFAISFRTLCNTKRPYFPCCFGVCSSRIRLLPTFRQCLHVGCREPPPPFR